MKIFLGTTLCILLIVCITKVWSEEDEVLDTDNEIGNGGDNDDMEPEVPPGDSIPPGATSFSFKPPEINEEEQHSSRIPSNLVCDGCKAVAYQVNIKYVIKCKN